MTGVADIQPTISTFSVTKGGRVEETYALFSEWDLNQSLDDNLARLRQDNQILARTDAWLKEMRRIFRVRFGGVDRHAPLIRLAQAGYPQERWSTILLWHLCMRELLLSDFLENWLFQRKEDGYLTVRSADVRAYLETLMERGLVDADWTENTINRMASGLPSYAADFGLLQGKTVKEIAPYHPPDEAIIYVLHSMSEETSSPERILGDARWRRFLISRNELEAELLRLHQLQRIHFETMGSVIHLELPYQSVDAYVKSLV